jgi:hypothetical protein
MRYLELNAEGVVKNIVVWDGVTPYAPEGVSELLPCDEHPGVSYGWRKVDGGWEAPPEPEPEPEELVE